MQKIVKEHELAIKELKEDVIVPKIIPGTGIGSIKESIPMVPKTPYLQIIGKKRIPDVKSLEKMSAKDLA